MSFPGLSAPVPRSPSVQVSALVLDGRPLALMASGFLARVIQHEVDHLNGVLFTDKAVRVWKPSADEDEIEMD